MAKINNNMKYGIFVLELIASLIFLGLAFTLPSTAASLASFAGLWAPLLYGTAILGSIVLFLVSFGTLAVKSGKTFAYAASCAVMATSFALVIFYYGMALQFAIALIGFIIGIIGVGMAHVAYEK